MEKKEKRKKRGPDGCGDLRYHNRNNSAFLCSRLRSDHRRSLQEPLLVEYSLLCSQSHPNSSLNSPEMGVCKRRMVLVVVGLVLGLCLDLGLVCASGEAHVHSHKCSHGHDHHGHGHQGQTLVGSKLLPEELAEEEDMKLYGFGFHSHGHDHFGALQLSVTGLWIHSLGCSLLVSMASLICLIILPVIFIQGKPSKAVVDSLALFGAGAMLGDAFLHQLPHAFGGGHSHSHDDHAGHDHHDHSEHEHSHAHSLEDLSVGIAVLAGIVLFLLVEKIVRYVEEHSGGTNAWDHGHHHHHHSKKLKDDNDSRDDSQSESSTGKDGRKSNVSSEEVVKLINYCLEGNSHHDSQLRKVLQAEYI